MALDAHRSNPGADIDLLLTIVNQLVTITTELKTDYNLLLAKLDLDGGVTDVNYASLRAITSATPDAGTFSY